MKNVEDIIKYYGNSGVEAYTIYHDNRLDWIDTTIAGNYLRRYGWPSKEARNWEELQKSLFHLDRQLPDMIFRKDAEFITLLGGAMFERKDFEQFKSCLQQIGDKHFLIAQDTFGMAPDQKQYALRMKYPSNIGWDELMSGNFISTVLFEPFYNHYYVFGQSGEWGMYVANEGYKGDDELAGEPTPLRIIGFNPKYRTIFRDTFKIPKGEYCESVDYIPEEERPDLKKWVPKIYRK